MIHTLVDWLTLPKIFVLRCYVWLWFCSNSGSLWQCLYPMLYIHLSLLSLHCPSTKHHEKIRKHDINHSSLNSLLLARIQKGIFPSYNSVSCAVIDNGILVKLKRRKQNRDIHTVRYVSCTKLFYSNNYRLINSQYMHIWSAGVILYLLCFYWLEVGACKP